VYVWAGLGRHCPLPVQAERKATGLDWLRQGGGRPAHLSTRPQTGGLLSLFTVPVRNPAAAPAADTWRRVRDGRSRSALESEANNKVSCWPIL
jgi:hypothetical protein